MQKIGSKYTARILVATMIGLSAVSGVTATANDGRTAIELTANERDFVLAEMRAFLESVQEITSAISEKDMETIAASASRVGLASTSTTPKTLMRKLPPAFRALGMKTHKAFDGIAVEAQDMGDAQVVLTQLGDLLRNCVACHEGYRLEVRRAE